MMIQAADALTQLRLPRAPPDLRPLRLQVLNPGNALTPLNVTICIHHSEIVSPVSFQH